jgi:hypothetical protein
MFTGFDLAENFIFDITSTFLSTVLHIFHCANGIAFEFHVHRATNKEENKAKGGLPRRQETEKMTIQGSSYRILRL